MLKGLSRYRTWAGMSSLFFTSYNSEACFCRIMRMMVIMRTMIMIQMAKMIMMKSLSVDVLQIFEIAEKVDS